MAKLNLTAGSASTTLTKARRVLIQVNAALTGTITVADGSTTVATITNPTVGAQFEYWDFQTSVIVTPSATCDITVNIDTSFGPK